MPASDERCSSPAWRRLGRLSEATRQLRYARKSCSRSCGCKSSGVRGVAFSLAWRLQSWSCFAAGARPARESLHARACATALVSSRPLARARASRLPKLNFTQLFLSNSQPADCQAPAVASEFRWPFSAASRRTAARGLHARSGFPLAAVNALPRLCRLRSGQGRRHCCRCEKRHEKHGTARKCRHRGRSWACQPCPASVEKPRHRSRCQFPL